MNDLDEKIDDIIAMLEVAKACEDEQNIIMMLIRTRAYINELIEELN